MREPAGEPGLLCLEFPTPAPDARAHGQYGSAGELSRRSAPVRFPVSGLRPGRLAPALAHPARMVAGRSGGHRPDPVLRPPRPEVEGPSHSRVHGPGLLRRLPAAGRAVPDAGCLLRRQLYPDPRDATCLASHHPADGARMHLRMRTSHEENGPDHPGLGPVGRPGAGNRPWRPAGL